MPLPATIVSAALLLCQSAPVTVRSPDTKLTSDAEPAAAHVPAFTVQCIAGRVIPLPGHDDDGALRSYARVDGNVQGALGVEGRCVVVTGAPDEQQTRGPGLTIQVCCDGTRSVVTQDARARILVDNVEEKRAGEHDWAAFLEPEDGARPSREMSRSH